MGRAGGGGVQSGDQRAQRLPSRLLETAMPGKEWREDLRPVPAGCLATAEPWAQSWDTEEPEAQLRGRQRHRQAGGVEAAEPGRPSLTVKAEEASWRRVYLGCPRRPWRESSCQRAWPEPRPRGVRAQAPGRKCRWLMGTSTGSAVGRQW